ncbi:MAG: HlyD family efflux transporter periplasmic adaptor subunit [Acidobacteria bacterium]|nr:HlyD family efflux transporter periplasmic adaptor subunit [Acidobacteriota bacterium]
MDVPRTGVARKKLIRRIIYGGIVVALIPLITWGLSRLQPAAPTVERATVWIDTVKRGPMVRNVRGLGTLVPEEVLWIPATTEGRVERILVRAGTPVKANTVLLELSNPQLENDALDAQYQWKAAEANQVDLRVKLESARLQQQASTAQLKAEWTRSQMQAERDAQLLKYGLAAEIQSRLSRTQADELANRHGIEVKRLEISEESVRAQLAAQQVQVDKLRALYGLKKSQVDQLKVRAGTDGVLQQLGSGAPGAPPFEVGQRVTSGTVLAKIAQPWKLKAELKIAETQAKDISLGQVTSIDTRNGVIAGKVVRIDPAVQNGTVTVDVKLEGELPQGARPDLSVDGTVELEKLSDVIQVGRPVFGQSQSQITLFRLMPDGKHAERVPVKLGRTSVNTIEILEGLKVGDQVVLSDMSAWDAHNRIRLN